MLVGLIRELLGRRDQWPHHRASARHCEPAGDIGTNAGRCGGATPDGTVRAYSCGTASPTLGIDALAAGHLLERSDLDATRRALLLECFNRDEAPARHSSCVVAWRAVVDVFFKDNGEPYKTVTIKQGFPQDRVGSEGAHAGGDAVAEQYQRGSQSSP